MVDIERLAREAAARHAALPPIDRALADIRQRQSWVHGEMRLGADDEEGYTEEQIAAIPKDPAVVLADAVEALRAQLTAAIKRAEDAERTIADVTSAYKVSRDIFAEAGRKLSDDLAAAVARAQDAEKERDALCEAGEKRQPNPEWEAKADAYHAEKVAEYGVEPQATLTMLERWKADAEPANEMGQTTFSRAMLDSATDALRVTLSDLSAANAIIAGLRADGEWRPCDLEVDYTNWRGERAWRRLRFLAFKWDSTRWHPEAQWLVDALDLDKGDHRTFAIAGMHAGRPLASPPSEQTT